MAKINLFLPITPYTMAISEKLITSTIYIGEQKNVLINPHGLSYRPELWDKVYLENVSREVSENKIQRYTNFAKQIFIFLKVYRKIKDFRKEQLNFYYVDLAHVLSNSIFFSFKGINKRFIIEDGLLNYYEINLRGKMLGNEIVNSFLGKLGLPTQSFEGHITGVEMQKVNGQYVFFPKLAFGSEKSLQIPYNSIFYEKEGNILILGQEPIINFIPIVTYKKSLETIIRYCKEKHNPQRIYYKPHHHGKKDLMKTFLQKELGEKLIMIENNSPIHSIVGELKPSIVISFGSTASLNLRLVLPDFVESWVYLIRNTKLEVNKEMENLFVKTGIGIKELFLENPKE